MAISFYSRSKYMKNKNSLIWKIEGKNISTSYLIGTMHVKDAMAFGRLEDMKYAIGICDVFAIEFNLEEANHNMSASGMDLPEGQTLELLLGTKKFNKMKKSIQKSFGFDIAFFNHSKPILLSNIITEKILSDDMQSSLDETLWLYAKEKEKVTLGVETFQEQLDILDQIPLEYQIKQLKEIAKNVSKFRKEIISMAKLFEKEDISKLYKKVKKSSGALRKIMLYDRNINMADRMAKMMEENTSCFAIGAGHLSGKKGVIKLLKDKGLKVKPVLK